MNYKEHYEVDNTRMEKRKGWVNEERVDALNDRRAEVKKDETGSTRNKTEIIQNCAQPRLHVQVS